MKTKTSTSEKIFDVINVIIYDDFIGHRYIIPLLLRHDLFGVGRFQTAFGAWNTKTHRLELGGI